VIENVSGELKKYLEGKPVISVLLSFGAIILYVALGIMLIGTFTFLGGFISTLIQYVFYLGIILCLANADFQALLIGLGGRTLIALIALIMTIASDLREYLNWWDPIFALLIFGFFTYLAYKKVARKA